MFIAQKTAAMDDGNGSNPNWSSSFHAQTNNAPCVSGQSAIVSSINFQQKDSTKVVKKTKSQSINKNHKRPPINNNTAVEIVSAATAPAGYNTHSTPVHYYVGPTHATSFMAKSNSKGYLDYGSSFG